MREMKTKLKFKTFPFPPSEFGQSLNHRVNGFKLTIEIQVRTPYLDLECCISQIQKEIYVSYQSP